MHTPPRVFAIGDIHGHLEPLRNAFETLAITGEDTVVFLGDYIDRGPESAGVLDFVMERARAYPDTTQCLFGNHEELFLDAAKRRSLQEIAMISSALPWYRVGGAETLRSYSGSDDAESRFQGHLEFLKTETKLYFETDSEIFVHGFVEPDMPIAEAPPEMLCWQRTYDTDPHCSGKRLVTGHTAQLDGVPLDLGHTICIDTFCYGGGYLTVYDCRNDIFHQFSAHGTSRSFTRDELSKFPIVPEAAIPTS